MTDQNQNWAAGLTDDTATQAAPQAQAAPQQAAPAPGADWAAGLTETAPKAATPAAEAVPQLPDNYGFTWEGLKKVPERFTGGIGQVVKFAGDVAKDISNPNKPLFYSDKGAEPGSQGESTAYKYLFAPQVEQFNQANEMVRQANEAKRRGDQEGFERNRLEAYGHWGASVIPVVGPWLGGQAEQAGKTGDILGTTAETAGQVVGGELLHKGVEIGIDKTTRVAGYLGEQAALKAGADPQVARTVGNIASLGTKNIAIDAHIDALDKAVDKHIAAKTDFEAKTAAVDTAKAAVDADPGDVNAKADLNTAQKALDKASSVYDSAGDVVDKVQNKILSELTPTDWSKMSPSHIMDIAQSAIGTTGDFDTAVTRFSNMVGKQAGEAFKSALSSVREDLKAIFNNDTEGKIVDPKTAADAIDAHIYQNIENPLQASSGEARGENSPVVQNFRARVEARIDKFFEENPGKAGSIEQEEKIKQQMLDRVMREQDLGDGSKAPREPNLYEAESIRQGLKKYEPNETSGYNQVAYELANFMREVIDEGYGERGVDGVKEARAKEAKLITISEGLRKAQPLFDKQEGEPTFKKVVKATGAALLVSTLGSMALHNPWGALTGLGKLWESLYDSNAKDLSKNLGRAKELAGREPESQATTPEITQRPAGQTGPGEDGGQGPQPTRPNLPPPPPPPAPAVRPQINHTLGGELAAHFPDVTEEPTTPEEFDALLKRFLSDYSEKLQGVKDFQAQNPGKPLPDGVKDEWDAAKDLKGKIMRERAKENAAMDKENQKRQDKYQSDLAKYNAKYQAEVAKADAKAKADAEAAEKKAEADAAAKSDALKNDPRIIHGAGGLMPATEAVRAIVGAGDHTSEQAHGHEGGGHVIGYASQGLDPFVFISDEHPDAKNAKGGPAAAAIQTKIDAAKPGAEGVFQRVIGMLGGPAWDEVHSGIDPADNKAGRGDFDQAKKALREEAGLTPSEVDVVMEELYNTAKEAVSKPEAIALVKANIAVREQGLPNTHHMSESRMAAYVKALKGVFGNGETTKTPTTDGDVSGEADGATPERESDLGGTEAKEPSGNAEKVPAGKVRESEGESGEGARGSGRGVEQANLAHEETDQGGTVRLGAGLLKYSLHGDTASMDAVQAEKGKGYGQQMLAEAEKQAAARGAQKMVAGVRNSVSMDAARMLERAGYEKTEGKIKGSPAYEKPLVEQANLKRTESARPQKYRVGGTDEEGNAIEDTIEAHSFDKARKMMLAKYPNAREIGVHITGENTPYGEYNVPKGKPLFTPDSKTLGPDDVKATMYHELGHYMVGHNEGFGPDSNGMLRHTHPEMPKGANAAVSWKSKSFIDRYTGGVRPDKLPSAVRMSAGGIAADEVFKGLDRAKNPNLITGGISDGSLMAKFLRLAGVPAEEIPGRINQMIDEAKEHLTKPHVRDVIEENVGTREPGLSTQYHFSPERLQSMGEEAKRRGAQNAGTNDNGPTVAEGNRNGGEDVGSREGEAAPAVGQQAAQVEQSNLSKAKAKETLDNIVARYGTSENVEPLRREHSFILPDGKLVHLEGGVHNDVIAEHGGGASNEKNGWDNRPEFINKSGAIRAHGFGGRNGDNLLFSVPKDGVTGEQADTMRRAAAQGFLRNGTLNIERADMKAATKDQLSRQKDFPRGGDVDQMLRDIQAHPDQKTEQSNLTKGTISTRLPSGKKATENPLGESLVIGRDSIDKVPGLGDKVAAKIKNYIGIALPAGKLSATQIMDHFTNHVKENLKDLYNQVDPAKREANAKWYDSANKLANNMATEHGITEEQASGAIASMSPQKDWDQNVSLAKRVTDIWHNKADIPMTSEMETKGKELATNKNSKGELTNPKLKGILKKIKGKSLNDISDMTEKAAWTRIYDEAHNPREFQRIDPGTGDEVGVVMTDKGEPRRVAWGSLNEISKALSILEDGSRENISGQLGEAHKVRNFYNNILDPNNPAGHVTIDTHAVAAGLQKPLSGKSLEVKDNFGGIGAKQTGAKGLYALYADAYRQAAGELGIQPRQLQSVVWEKVREQFPDEFKRAGGEVTHPQAIEGIWKQYDAGKMTLDQTRKAVRQYAKDAVDKMQGNKATPKSPLDFISALRGDK